MGFDCSCTGSVYIFIAIATLIGTPTAGALLKVVDEKHFNALIIFTGVLLAAGTVALVVWLVGLLFPTNAAVRGEPLGLMDEAHPVAGGHPDASDQEQGSP